MDLGLLLETSCLVCVILSINFFILQMYIHVLQVYLQMVVYCHRLRVTILVSPENDKSNMKGFTELRKFDTRTY